MIRRIQTMRLIKARRIAAAMMLCSSLAVASPMIAFAQTGPEADCICEAKCEEDKVNDQCPACKKDIALCQGQEAPAEPEESAEPEGPLTPDGNMTLVDDYGDRPKAGKQFITMTSKNGNYFYLIIDRDDNGNETVHFLNMVDESDLLSLMDKDEQKKYADAIDAENKEKEEKVKPEKTEPVKETPEPKAEKKKPKVPVGSLVLLVALGIGGIGFYFYKKVNAGTKKEDKPDPDLDYYENEDEGDYLDELDNDQTDNKE
jgi:hypothetical protein